MSVMPRILFLFICFSKLQSSVNILKIISDCSTVMCCFMSKLAISLRVAFWRTIMLCNMSVILHFWHVVDASFLLHPYPLNVSLLMWFCLRAIHFKLFHSCIAHFWMMHTVKIRTSSLSLALCDGVGKI